MGDDVCRHILVWCLHSMLQCGQWPAHHWVTSRGLRPFCLPGGCRPCRQALRPSLDGESVCPAGVMGLLSIRGQLHPHTSTQNQEWSPSLSPSPF